MNITAQEARRYAEGWKGAQEALKKIEKEIENASKEGAFHSMVYVNRVINEEAINLVKAECKRNGFRAEFGKEPLKHEAWFLIDWDYIKEEDDK